MRRFDLLNFFLQLYWISHRFTVFSINFPFFFFYSGKNSGRNGIVKRFSTAAALEDLIVPAVQIAYSQNLIDGKFVDAASGKLLTLS